MPFFDWVIVTVNSRSPAWVLVLRTKDFATVVNTLCGRNLLSLVQFP
jgi:hypothetical protein